MGLTDGLNYNPEIYGGPLGSARTVLIYRTVEIGPGGQALWTDPSHRIPWPSYSALTINTWQSEGGASGDASAAVLEVRGRWRDPGYDLGIVTAEWLGASLLFTNPRISGNTGRSHMNALSLQNGIDCSHIQLGLSAEGIESREVDVMLVISPSVVTKTHSRSALVPWHPGR